MSHHRIVLAAVIAILAQAGAGARSACPQFFAGGQPPALLNPQLARRTTLHCNAAYASLASGVTHGALWSAEYLTDAELAQAHVTRREGRFHADDRLPYADRAELADYRGSGFDRGHMTPSGDMPGEIAQEESFSLANMVPQSERLNRGPWEGIESAMRHRAERGGPLYVVTGPAFRGRQLAAIGADNVLVPSSTWKAVYDPGAEGTGVYVCTNTEQPSCSIVSVSTMIQATGIDPFPALPAEIKQAALSLPTPEASPYETVGHGRRNESLLERLLGD